MMSNQINFAPKMYVHSSNELLSHNIINKRTLLLAGGSNDLIKKKTRKIT